MAQGCLLDERMDTGASGMLTVALVCVPGGIFSQWHVDRLIPQIDKHLTIPHEFHVIRKSNKPGWFAKIDLFEPGRFKDRVLYLDLDVTVIGSLDDIVRIDAPFAAIKDYQYPMTLNSSVMTWDSGAADHVFNEFEPSVMARFRGDQNWIYNRIPGARRFPKEWCVSYKLSKLTGIPNDARVVVYHGESKPW
jgi:hypothetical protein